MSLRWLRERMRKPEGLRERLRLLYLRKTGDVLRRVLELRLDRVLDWVSIPNRIGTFGEKFKLACLSDILLDYNVI